MAAPKFSNSIRLRFIAAGRLLLAGAIVLLAFAVAPPPAHVTAQFEFPKMFLPLVLTTPPPPIRGRMTDHGAGAGGVPLELSCYYFSQFHVVEQFTTDANGYYRFVDPATYSCRVEYSNDTDPNRLRFLQVTGVRLSGGEPTVFGTHDLANIPLLTPADGASAAFPVTFQWAARPWSSDAVYSLIIQSDIQNYDIYSYFFRSTSDDHTTLISLPNDFKTDVMYEWFVYIATDNDIGSHSFGGSFQTYTIRFEP